MTFTIKNTLDGFFVKYTFRHDKHSHMEHYFASIAIVYDKHFEHLSDQPQIPIQQLDMEHVLLSDEEYAMVRSDVSKLVVDILVEHCAQFKYLQKAVPKDLVQDPIIDKPKVVRLPTLPYHEQKYQDVVKILEYYEQLVGELQNQAQIPAEERGQFHIGGDQLTRERFSWAKALRLGNPLDADRFGSLCPITFEHFHLMMRFLEKIIFGKLYDKESDLEIGTMRCEAQRIHRNEIDPEVMKAYDADREFTISFYKSYVIEALMEYLGMENLNDIPADIPTPDSRNVQEWISEKIGDFVDRYIFPGWSRKEEQVHKDTRTVKQAIRVKLANGKEINLPMEDREEVIEPPKPDKIKDYGHLVLETGTVFYYFLKLCKSPKRSKLLAILKMIMIIMKANNNLAKYPLEILRLLISQYSLSSEKEAHQILHQNFVNTTGKSNGSVPTDQVMEWHVKESKTHIKHMVSNKTEANISKRSASLGDMSLVASNYSNNIGVRIRAKKHKKVSALEDEVRLIEDLRGLRPFRYTPERAHAHFKTIPQSFVKLLDGHKFHVWFNGHKNMIDK